MEVEVEWWWNERYGRLARYDLRLMRWDWPDTRPSVWRVEATKGGADGKWWASIDLTEQRARKVLEDIKAKRSERWMRLR